MPWAPSSEATRAGPLQRLGLGVGEDVHDARTPAVRLRAAEPQHVDVLAGHRADHVGTGHEDPSLGAQDHQVGERRSVRRPARGRPQHDRDLRDLAGRLRHRVEDLAHRVQGEHPLGEAGPAGVPQPHDRSPVGEGALVGVHDRLAAHLTHRAAHDRRVGAERDDVGAVHLADRRQHAAAVVLGDQLEGALVEERREPVVRVAGVLLAGRLGRPRRRGPDGRGGCRGHRSPLSTSRRRPRRWSRRSRRSC